MDKTCFSRGLFVWFQLILTTRGGDGFTPDKTLTIGEETTIIEMPKQEKLNVLVQSIFCDVG